MGSICANAPTSLNARSCLVLDEMHARAWRHDLLRNLTRAPDRKDLTAIVVAVVLLLLLIVLQLCLSSQAPRRLDGGVDRREGVDQVVRRLGQAVVQWDDCRVLSILWRASSSLR